jgi:hypothetical protein
MFCNKLFFLAIISLCVFCNHSQPGTNFMGTEIKSSQLLQMNKLDSIISSPIQSTGGEAITCYFLDRNRATVAFIDLACSTKTLLISEIVNDSILDRKQTVLDSKEAEDILNEIEKTKLSELKSIEDAIVDDGYTAIVKISNGERNVFSVRAFTRKGKKSSQYKFVEFIAKILKSKGVRVNIG